MNTPQYPNDQHASGTAGKRVIQPLPGQFAQAQDQNAAADLIRKKLDSLYADEPPAKEELAEVVHLQKRSKHQEYMYKLSNAGLSLAEVQTRWHEYYTNLNDQEKHEVWQEFYQEHQAHRPSVVREAPQPLSTAHSQHTNQYPGQAAPAPTPTDTRKPNDIKNHLLQTINARAGKGRSSHLRSLMFGLSMGCLTLMVFLFSFFNERFIAPFITPSRSVSSTPLIIDPATSAVGPESKIIIPKINVEIPIVFDEPTINEDAIQRALEKGVVWYPTTAAPGEIGNGAIFGHSANNILNKGKYKFAFVLLKRLENGDTFYIQKDGKRYVYRVFHKEIVSPDKVSVLYPSFPDKPSTFTLITCDPPGTSLNRLVVTAEQITPDPAQNVASKTQTATQAQPTPAELPSNSITLWQRIKNIFS